MRDFTGDHSALALNTATLGHNVAGHGAGWSPERTIDACVERGYGGIVFWRREIGSRAVSIGEYARSVGLPVTGLCRAPFLVGPSAPTSRQVLVDDFMQSLDMAAALQAPVLTGVVGGVESGSRGVSESLRRVTDIVAQMAPHADQRGVRLALEPLHPVYGGNRSCLVTIRDALDVCLATGSQTVGLAVDVYHTWWDTSLPQQLARAGRSRLLSYHLCDWLPDADDILLDRGMMGDGVADLKAIRRAMEDAGYEGVCEVEIFSAAKWWKRDPGEVLDICVQRFRAEC
jgi:sugar phosphate isomerase/epimerase